MKRLDSSKLYFLAKHFSSGGRKPVPWAGNAQLEGTGVAVRSFPRWGNRPCKQARLESIHSIKTSVSFSYKSDQKAVQKCPLWYCINVWWINMLWLYPMPYSQARIKQADSTRRRRRCNISRRTQSQYLRLLAVPLHSSNFLRILKNDKSLNTAS